MQSWNEPKPRLQSAQSKPRTQFPQLLSPGQCLWSWSMWSTFIFTLGRLHIYRFVTAKVSLFVQVFYYTSSVGCCLCIYACA